MAKVRIAILGAGRWGEKLVRTFWELLGRENLIVCDPQEERLALMAERFPGLVTSPGPVFTGVDGVVIATPVSTHYSMAKEALTAGKHVLVEKPLALKVPEAEELVHLAEESGLVLMVDHLLEYHPAVRKLRELINAGKLGRLYHVSSERLNLGVIRTEENALWSLAPHDISVILHLLGEMPIEVAAQGEAFLQQGIEDVAFVTLKFPSKVIAYVRVSWLDPIKTRKMTIVGERAMAVFDEMADSPLTLIEYRAIHHGSRWEVERVQPVGIEVEREELLRVVAKTFLTAIEGREKPLSDGQDGLRVLRVLSAADRSMGEGGRPVPVLVRETSKRQRAFVHETAFIDEGVEIGEGTKIWHFSHVMRGAKIGKHCTLGQNVFVGPNVKIGNNVKIQNNVSVYEGVTVEDDVFLGPSCVFTNVDRPRSAFARDRAEYLETVVKRGATIGANATVVCGHTLGEYCFVGAGAVVTKDVPPYALVYGNPARIHGWVCQCGQRFEFKDSEVVCSHCGRRYRKEGERVQPLQEGSPS